jgi:hypothetical protein
MSMSMSMWTPCADPADGCCFSQGGYGVDALCVASCGAGSGTNCRTVCEYFGVPYVSPKQCRNAGTLKNWYGGESVVGNKVCARSGLEPSRRACCRCDKFSNRNRRRRGRRAAACLGWGRECGEEEGARCCRRGLKCSPGTKRCVRA